MQQALDDERSSRLDPRSVIAGRIAGGIVLSCVAFPTLITVGIVALTTPWDAMRKVGLGVAWLGLIGLWAVCAFSLPELRYRVTRYRVDERGLIIRRGIFWRSITSVPKSRIQHTDVVQGPLQRQFQLATLIVHTAGTQDASVSLDGLAHQTATLIRDLLIGESQPNISDV